MNIKKLASMAGLVLGLTLAAGAQAALLYSFEDDDIDFIMRDGQVLTSGTLSVGDVFVSALEIPIFTINGVNALPAGQEMTGVAAVQLLTIAGPLYTFGVYGGLGSLGVPGCDGAGAALCLYLNGTSGAGGDRDLILNRSILPGTNCTSLADCLDQASRGTLFQVDGFGLDPDEFWLATQILPGGGDIATVLGAGNATLVAGFNLGLSTLFNANGPVEFLTVGSQLPCGNPGYVADGCVQFFGSGTITGGQGLSNGAIAHSDFDAQKFVAAVPEPGTLALLAVGLLGLGAGFPKRRT